MQPLAYYIYIKEPQSPARAGEFRARLHTHTRARANAGYLIFPRESDARDFSIGLPQEGASK